MNAVNNHRYILEPYKGPASRVRCPSCGKPREFTRYLNTETGDLLPDHVGRCNREDKCGYHFTPAQHFESRRPIRGYPEMQNSLRQTGAAKRGTPPPREIDFLPLELVGRSMARHDENNFIIYLKSLFGSSMTEQLIARYLIGTSKHWPGATVFWQIDERERVRQAKVMLYNPETGRRVKDEGAKVFFAGKSLLKNDDANLVQCFFGQYLLAERPTDRVGIVESEKTAIIASVYFPRLIWLAPGGKHGARWTDPCVCSALKGRNIILFPDLGATDAWREKADALRKAISCRVSVSDLLETIATETQQADGWDLADFLVKKDGSYGWAVTDEGYPVMWDVACS